VVKHLDMPDPKPGAGDVLVRAAGIGINREDMLERNGDTKDRYRSAGCRFKSNDANVRVDSPIESHLLIGQKSEVHSNYSKYGAVALRYRLRGYIESVTRLTTRAPVFNYSALGTLCAVRGVGKAASEQAGVGFDQQDRRERDRSSADLPERCKFDRQIAESNAANRANRDAAAH
jgi:hypothetical protein